MKKTVYSGLAAVLCLALGACGGASGGSDEKAFKIGGCGPLSGNNAVYGEAVKNGAQIAVDEVNAEGEVRLNFRYEDDQADTEAAVNAYNTLADWGMQASIGATTSGSGQAISPLYAKDHIFAITPSGSSLGVIYRDAQNAKDPYGNVFQMCFTDPNQGVASADYLSSHPELGTKIAIIYRNDDNYSSGVYATFMQEAESKNLDIVYEGTFTKDTTDFSVQVQQAQAAGADIVFLPIYYQPASLILQTAKSLAYTPTFFGCDGMDGILTQENFDTSLAEGLYMLTPFSADAQDETTRRFVQTYKEKYGEVPNQFAADAYDAIHALAQALRDAKVSANDDAGVINEALIQQFTTMTFQGITGTGDITWNADGEVSKGPRAVVIKDGVYVNAE